MVCHMWKCSFRPVLALVTRLHYHVLSGSHTFRVEHKGMGFGGVAHGLWYTLEYKRVSSKALSKSFLRTNQLLGGLVNNLQIV